MAGTKPSKAKAKAKTLDASRGGNRKAMKRPSARGGGRGGGGRRQQHQQQQRRSGPRLPAAMRRELDELNPNAGRSSDEEAGSDYGGGDVYEYEEEVAEEEAGKNRRYDAVEKYEYEFHSDDAAEDEDVPSEEGDDAEDDEDDADEEDNERQLRILQETTGMPKEAFADLKNNQGVDLPLQQEDGGNQRVTIHDLLECVQGKPGYSQLRKRALQQESKPMVVHTIPKVERERLERGVVYREAKKEVTKWEPLVKRNREASTLFFEDDLNLGVSTVGAIANDFKPRSDFEKKMAEIIRSSEMVEAHKHDGAKILELNKIDIEDVKAHQDRLAKMRSLLFRHELKAKRVKKIKSRTYHRILKKDRLKAVSAELEADPEAARENAMKQEFKRAEERMTLKHKNSSKWAKRIKKRGLDTQDEATRAAVEAQLQQHALLTRKMNSMNDGSSSSEESTDEDDDEMEDSERSSKLLNRAKEKTLKVLEDDNEIPKSGVSALPFMVRSLEKRQEAAREEARLALQEYDEALGNLEDDNIEENGQSTKMKGKRAFGPTKNVRKEASKRPKGPKLDDVGINSDGECDSESAAHMGNDPEVNKKAEDVQLGTALLDDEPQMAQDSLFRNFHDIAKDPGPKTTYEVGVWTDNTWKKVKSNKEGDNSNGDINKSAMKVPTVKDQNPKEMDQDSDSDSDEEMIEGILTTSGRKENYELPSQADLIRQAFAGDDVEAEFEKDKMEVLNQENPEPEKPDLVPGWGQWTHVQQKKGLPAWMVEEHENATKKREAALKRRMDARLKHVIISENVDKKSEKLLANVVPYPYDSKDAYEQSIRMPMGPDFNPAMSVSALNRPAIVKKPGVVIKPLSYEEVDPHDKPDEPKRVIQRVAPNPKAKKARGKKTQKADAQKRK